MRGLQVWGEKRRDISFASVLLNAGTLVGSNVLSAGLGVIYWGIAARSFDPSEVGMASAALAATLLVGSLSALGTTTLLVGELPRRTTIERSRLVMTAMLVTGTAGAILGVAFAVMAPLLSPELRSFVGEWPSATIVIVMVCATAVAGVIDHALIGLLRGEVQFARNTVLAIVKLGALLVVAGLALPNRALVLYATWLVGTLASFAAVVPLAGVARLPRSAYRPQLEMLRHLGRSALQHHALNLSLTVPTSVLPLVVTVLLSATANAYFYVASMFASLVYMVPLALSTTLYAVASHAPAALASRTRFTFILSMAAGLCANVFFLVAARPILALLGRGYIDEVDWVLRILLIAVFPVTVKAHFVALCQVKRLVGRAALFVSLAGLVEIGSAAVGAMLGDLHTLTVAYVLVICAEGIILAPVVLRLAAASSGEAELPSGPDAVAAQHLAQDSLQRSAR